MSETPPPTPPAPTGAEANPAPAAPAADAAPAPPGPEELLANAKQEAAANYDRYLRAVADLENYRRRAIREKEELRQFGATNLLQSLLPVLDNLQLGLTAAKQNADAATIAHGVSMVVDQLRGALEQHGLREINPAGQKFDPHLHESISHLPSAEVPEEQVTQVVRVGYSLHGRLLRPASVVLSSGPEKKSV
jgi:molecular chaperone GrpE